MTEQPAQEERPWHAAFPEPRTTAPLLERDKVFRMLNGLGDLFTIGLLLVDVRRTDYEGGTIQGSLNIPAQSFHMNMAVLHRLCKGAGIDRVAFYCGSSSGRGPRCAGWFADYVSSQAEEGEPVKPEVFTLEGGIKGWAKGGPQYTHFIDGFNPEYWKQVDTQA